MKRFFFSLIALSAAAIGCTQSALLETPDFGGTEISFSPYTGRTPVTRAASVENAAGLANASATAAANADPNGFYVYGFLNQINGETKTTSVYLDNKKVYSPSKGANANDWTYEGLVYWPDSQSESTLDFVAYSANGVGKGLSEITKDGFTFTVNENVANQVDLLATRYYAGNTYDNTTNGTTKGQLSLQFHHLLSRVGFKVQSTTSKKVTITALTFTGKMPTQGTLDFDAANEASSIPALQTTSTGTPTYNCLTGTAAAATSGRVPGTEYLMIMPHIAGAEYEGNTDNLKGSDHKVNVTYTIEGSDQVRESTVTLPIGFEFAAGKAYEIVLKISTSSLSFDVQEQDWNTTDNNADINPNDPPIPEEDEEEETPEVYTETSISASNLEFSIVEITNNSAVVQLKVLSNEYEDVTYNTSHLTTGTADMGDLAIAYRQQGSGQWNMLSPIESAPKGSTYEFTLNLTHSTIYECCVYIEKRTFTYKDNNFLLGGQTATQTSEVKGYGQIAQNGERKYLTFSTKSPIIYPVFTIDDVDNANIVQDSNNQFSATINGSYTLGSIDGDPIKIKEYGFCWVMGSGEPNPMDDKKAWTVAPDANTTSYNLQHTISGLKPNTTYNYRAYVIMTEDVEVYECSEAGQIIPSYSKVFSEDEIVYSPMLTFKTGAIVDNDNETGDDWGDGEDVEIDGKNK